VIRASVPFITFCLALALLASAPIGIGEEGYSFEVLVEEGENIQRAGEVFGEALVDVGSSFLLKVTIVNTGAFPDNYTVFVSDTAGWEFALADAGSVEVQPGESASIEVLGQLSEESGPGTHNTIYVRVRNSQGTEESVSLRVWVLREPGFNERYLITGIVVVVLGVVIVFLLWKGPLAE
jgi:hypothetical protein